MNYKYSQYMTIKRTISQELINAALRYKVVTVTGPRQSGKSTLVSYVFPEKPYISMEDIDNRELARTDPRGFLNRYENGAILDEIQRVPELLSYIQTLVDEKQINGFFILTGSNQFSLLNSINQSLAGRTALLKLLAFSIQETSAFSNNYTVDDYLFNGFYPAIYSENLNASKTYGYYIETYIERDLRQMIKLKDLSLFQKFLHLCAGRIGNIINMSHLSNETGVSVNTINSWISILEASFIIYKLPPWYDNISKRLIKSPKLYFYDTGIASFLLGIRKKEHLINHPLRGNLFENLVINEIIKSEFNKGNKPNLYFFRDSHGNEVDLIIQNGHNLQPIEIKSAETFHPAFLKSLKFIKAIYKGRIEKSHLIYAGKSEQELNDVRLINYKKSVSCLND